MARQSRRSFLGQSGAGLGAGWLAAHWPAVLAAAGQGTELTFFTPAQAADLGAMSSRIIPGDDGTAGAHEAGCLYFIDRALMSFLRESQPLYLEGLRQLQRRTLELFPGAGTFAALSAAQQDQLLTEIEHGAFFGAVRAHTIIGMFASPLHGGNDRQAGWKLIGFEDTLRFEPPFGYYDSLHPID